MEIKTNKVTLELDINDLEALITYALQDDPNHALNEISKNLLHNSNIYLYALQEVSLPKNPIGALNKDAVITLTFDRKAE